MLNVGKCSTSPNLQDKAFGSRFSSPWQGSNLSLSFNLKYSDMHRQALRLAQRQSDTQCPSLTSSRLRRRRSRTLDNYSQRRRKPTAAAAALAALLPPPLYWAQRPGLARAAGRCCGRRRPAGPGRQASSLGSATELGLHDIQFLSSHLKLILTDPSAYQDSLHSRDTGTTIATADPTANPCLPHQQTNPQLFLIIPLNFYYFNYSEISA